MQNSDISKSTSINDKLRKIVVETPIRLIELDNMPYSEAEKIVSEDLKKLHSSNFYQKIYIHYGVKSQNRLSLREFILEREKQILQHKIALQKESTNKILSAKTLDEVQKIQQQYSKDLQLIQSRLQQFQEKEFTPWIYIETTRKKNFYGQLFQQFDTKGVALFKAKLGYRSPFYLLDKIQFSMEAPPIEVMKKRNYYQFGLTWQNPISFFGQSTFYSSLIKSSNQIFRGVDQKKNSLSFGIQKQDLRAELNMTQRSPFLYDELFKYCSKKYHIPSFKASFKIDKTISDTIEKGDIATGKFQEGKIQATLPYLSQVQFWKAQYNYRRFFDIFKLSERFSNKKIKSFIQNSSVETNFSLKSIFRNKQVVSDLQQNIQIRGFENDRRPSQSVFQVKGSVKLNNYNYPTLGGVGILPFFYAQAGLSLQQNIKRPYILGSTGLGVSFALAKTINLEVLYSILQAQNRPLREPVNFQIRIGLFD